MVEEKVQHLGDMLAQFSINIGKQLEQFTETLADINISFENEKNGKYAWPIHGNLTPAEAVYIQSLYNKKSAEARDEIDDYMLRKYDKQLLERIVKNWERKKWLASRMPILRQAVEAHLEGKYWVAIPAILPQVEGIIVEGYGHDGMVPFNTVITYLDELLSTDDRRSIRKMLNKRVNQFINKVLFRHNYKALLNRHAILHGWDIDYGTQVNSLKAILLFDQLSNLIYRLVGTRRGKSYHIVECHAIDMKKRKNLVFFTDLSTAMATGRMPCKLCNPHLQ